MTVLFIRISAVYETVWKNVVELGRPQTKIWRMRIASYILKATNTISQYVIHITLPLQQWLHKRASMLRFMYIACIFESIIRMIFTLQNITHLCGNKMPTRCNRGFCCRSYCLLNMFRASLCP